MQNVTLSVNLLNAIMQYLSTKPFNEVSGLISGVQNEVSKQQGDQPRDAVLPQTMN